jgi:hypothetical protein
MIRCLGGQRIIEGEDPSKPEVVSQRACSRGPEKHTVRVMVNEWT